MLDEGKGQHGGSDIANQGEREKLRPGWETVARNQVKKKCYEPELELRQMCTSSKQASFKDSRDVVKLR